MDLKAAETAWFYLQDLVRLLVVLFLLIGLQRGLHQEIQWSLVLITRRPEVALGIFALLFFPGVLLHELSHFLMAQILMVKTISLSLIPKALPGRRLSLGYVEMVPSDWLRDSIVGAAPLLSGGVAIIYLANRLGLTPLASLLEQNNWDAFWTGLVNLPLQPDFWMWFYLAFAISSTMLPSDSDRRTWLPLALVIVALAGLALLAGAGPWMLENLTIPLNRIFRLLTTILGISLGMHLALVIPMALFRRFLTRVTSV